MKQVVMFNGSPRMDGNIATILNMIERGVQDGGAEVKTYTLFKMKFMACQSCFKCRTGDCSVRICFGKCVRFFNRIVFKKEELMERKKRQNTVLDACSEEVQQSTKRGISRRKFVQTSAGVVAAGALLGKRAFAAPRPLKIGYVSPETGALAPFGEADAFVIDEIRKMVQGGIQAGGTTRQVEILVRDSQSSPNRCAEVAAELIKSDKVDLMLVAGTPDTVNPVADQCEINQVPCVSTDAPWQPYFFGRGGNPDKGFDWTYHFFWGADQHSAGHVRHVRPGADQ